MGGATAAEDRDATKGTTAAAAEERGATAGGTAAAYAEPAVEQGTVAEGEDAAVAPASADGAKTGASARSGAGCNSRASAIPKAEGWHPRWAVSSWKPSKTLCTARAWARACRARLAAAHR